jgi:hypothetical protein
MEKALERFVPTCRQACHKAFVCPPELEQRGTLAKELLGWSAVANRAIATRQGPAQLKSRVDWLLEKDRCMHCMLDHD